MEDQQAAADTSPIDDTENIDFDLLPELVGYQLRRAQISVFQDFVETMSAVQVTPGQFGVLTLIGANPGLSQSALARAVGIERSTMVAVIDALQARDLVERRPSPVDRRSYALVLSAAGRGLLDEIQPLLRAHEMRIGKRLSDAERATLINLLDRISD